MKKFYTLMLAMGLLGAVRAQTISTFEENVLADSTYYNGDDYSGGFSSGNAFFYNYYDTTWGAAFGFWADGWAYSNIGDTITQPSDYATQLFHARETSGYGGSDNFALGTQGSRIVLTGSAAGKSVAGFYITNTTYTYNSMKLGDSFAKKFGGPSGNDPDYFKLVIKKYQGGSLATDSVEFYLADFRFSDNSQDYIVNEWTWVNLTSLGDADSLEFALSSSDVGSFGINTPVYFCIDNFITNNSPTAVTGVPGNTTIGVYPNPCVNTINIRTGLPVSVYTITDIQGKNVMTGSFNQQTTLDVSVLPAGIYHLQANDKTIKFVKQ